MFLFSLNRKRSIRSLAEERGIKYATVTARIRAGMSKNEALSHTVPTIQKVIVGTVEFSSFEAACKHYNKNPNTIRYRIKNGWSIDQALDLVERNNRNKSAKSLLVGTKKFVSIVEAAKYYGISPRDVNNRINTYGWTLEEAFELVKKKTFIVNGKDFTTLKEACKVYNTNRYTISNRLNKGWTIDEAFNIVKRKNTSKCKGYVYIIRNVVNSKVYIGVTTYTINRRYNQHVNKSKYTSSLKLYKAMSRIGVENFYVEKLDETLDRHDLMTLEMRYIKEYDSINNGYNSSTGGSNIGDKHGKGIIYKGVKYISHQALANHLNLSRTELWRRVKNSTL